MKERYNLTLTGTVICILIIMTSLLIQGCDEDRVPIPPADQDHLPIIDVNAVASGGGEIQIPEAGSEKCTSPCRSYVSINANLVFTIYAKNPGGVRTLSVTISQDGNILYNVNRSSTPDSQNKVLTTLSILGTDGAGGIGSNPLLVNMKTQQTEVKVEVTAINFNSQPSSYTITYYVREEVENEIIFNGINVTRGGEIYSGCEYSTCKGSHANSDKCQYTSVEGTFKLKNISDHQVKAQVFTCILFSRNRWAENNFPPNIIQGRNPCNMLPDSDWEGNSVNSDFQTWQAQEEKEIHFRYNAMPVAYGSCSGWPTYECKGKTTSYLVTYVADGGSGPTHIYKNGWGKSSDFYKRTIHCKW